MSKYLDRIKPRKHKRKGQPHVFFSNPCLPDHHNPILPFTAIYTWANGQMVFRFLDCVSCTIIVHVALTLISVVYKTKTIKEGFCIEGTWSREPLIYRGQQWSPVSLNLRNLVGKRIGKKMRGWKKWKRRGDQYFWLEIFGRNYEG